MPHHLFHDHTNKSYSSMGEVYAGGTGSVKGSGKSGMTDKSSASVVEVDHYAGVRSSALCYLLTLSGKYILGICHVTGFSRYAKYVLSLIYTLLRIYSCILNCM
jgi:hypothetical protein